MSKEEIIAAMQTCAQKLGRPPSLTEFTRESGITPDELRAYFGGIGDALRAAGVALSPLASPVDPRALLIDWACVARRLGRVPSRELYQKHGRYSSKCMILRFGAWTLVAVHFLHFARESPEAEERWRDVVRMVAGKLGLTLARKKSPPLEAAEPEPVDLAPPPPSVNSPLVPRSNMGRGEEPRLLYVPPPGLLAGRPVSGSPLLLPGLGHEPANEAGVLFVFGMMAHRLGFHVTSLQSGFPDCEAMRELQPGKWQRVRVEFEFESRNFKDHGHDPALCDVIVCWSHNWPECPGQLDVVELSRVVRAMSG